MQPQDSSAVAASAEPHTDLPPNVMLELVREMRGQRESFDEGQRLASAERKSERRWRMLFQALVFGMPVVLGILYFLFFLSSTGFRWGPFGDVVGIVRIEGPIGANEHASAEAIVPLLEKAFANANVKAVVLSIDSPGGAPVESERIYTAIGSLKKKHPKPVVAVINNIGASAAFMIALHADKIVAGKYSLVGSIGAIMAPWQFDRAIAKVDVSQRVYASGKLKAFLNPFTPVSPEVDSKAQRLVDQLGHAFLDEVKAKRGARLKEGIDVATGEVWPGPEAKELGLVDAVGTIDEYVAANYGVRAYDFGPSNQSLPLLGRTLQDAMVGAMQRMSTAIPEVR
ncbi:MAG: S49 family peptidase [Burkholderiales bacterium]|jgi:protease IV|nr:MAG: S49 family peptidase [Burkholderiales bacterium]